MRSIWRDVPRAAAFSGLGWLALAVLKGEWLAHTLLGFALVTLVPLGFSLTLEGAYRANASARDRQEVPFAYRLALLSMPGLLGGGFFVFSGLVGQLPGVMSAGLIGIFTAVVGLYGLQRVVRRGLRPRTELAVDLACLLLPVGAVWLFASRLGTGFLGYQEPTILLTAEHFFHAGFGAPLLFGVLGRHVTGKLVKPHGIATAVVCAGIPLTAAGIAAGRMLEVPAALVLGAGMTLGAVCMLFVAKEKRAAAPVPALLLAVSGASLFLSMTLAAVWAVTGSGKDATAGSALSTLDQMLRWHGAVNSFGFLGCGLVALVLLEMSQSAMGSKP